MSLGDRARSGKYKSLAVLASLAWLLPTTLLFGFNLATSRVLAPADYGIASVVRGLSSVPKGVLVFGLIGVLVCWLAQKEGNTQGATSRGQLRTTLVLLAFAAVVLTGFALLSYGIAPLYGEAFAAGR